MPENWKTIPGFPRYMVSDRGNIRVMKDNMAFPVRSRFDSDGYQIVTLWSKRRYHTLKVHRLVLEAFVGPCPDGYVCDHINTVRNDNRLENLRWVSERDNHWNPLSRVRYRNKGNRVRCVETGEEYVSVSAAALHTGAKRSHIGEVCKGKARSTGGLTFVYVEVKYARS